MLTNAKGFTLYSFAPDTSTKSNCNGACAKYWPPVRGRRQLRGQGHVRHDQAIQRLNPGTFDGHPLYTYVGDTAPGQAKGNGLNLSGGVWHEVTTSGSAPGGGSSSGSSGGGGY